MRLLDDLHHPDAETRLRALRTVRAGNIQDERIKLAVEAIMHGDGNLYLQAVAKETIKYLGSENVPSRRAENLFQFDDSYSDREILEKTLLVLAAQQKMLEETQNKVGCLHQFMFGLVVINVLAGLLSVLAG